MFLVSIYTFQHRYGGLRRGSLKEEQDEDREQDTEEDEDEEEKKDEDSNKVEEKVEEEEKVEKKKKKRREQKTSSSDMLSSRRIQTGDIIKITLDCCSGSRKLSFSLNGENLGVAFGPKGSGAAVELSDQENLGDKLSEELYPAVSLLSKDDHVSFESGGLIESHTMSLPWLVDILRTCSGLAARLASTMVAGEPVDTKEAEMEPWLQSPLLSSGLEEEEAKIILEDVDDISEGYKGFVLPMSWQTACLEANRADSPVSLRRAFSRGSSSTTKNTTTDTPTTPPRLKKSSSSPLLQLRSSSSGGKLKDARLQVRRF